MFSSANPCLRLPKPWLMSTCWAKAMIPKLGIVSWKIGLYQNMIPIVCKWGLKAPAFRGSHQDKKILNGIVCWTDVRTMLLLFPPVSFLCQNLGLASSFWEKNIWPTGKKVQGTVGIIPFIHVSVYCSSLDGLGRLSGCGGLSQRIILSCNGRWWCFHDIHMMNCLRNISYGYVTLLHSTIQLPCKDGVNNFVKLQA